MTDFEREVDTTIAGALNPGERVLWTGHCLSRMGKQKKATAAIGTPVSILSLSLAAVLGLSVCLITRVPLLALIVLVATGVSVVFLTRNSLGADVQDGDMYCRKQTVYVLTNQRALVLRNCRTRYPVHSLLWAYADEVRAEGVKPDGRGTVQFLSWEPVEQRWVRSLRFFMVGNARSVAEQAVAARDAARG